MVSQKSPWGSIFVIPAKAGIQLFQWFWTPVFTGVTVGGTYYEIIVSVRADTFLENSPCA
jgi:hypothetical protein